jgi:hypothetical protein
MRQPSGDTHCVVHRGGLVTVPASFHSHAMGWRVSGKMVRARYLPWNKGMVSQMFHFRLAPTTLF